MNKPKLSPKLVADLVAHVSSGFSAMLYTDHELFEKINEQLPFEMQVCYRTFQRYKADAIQYGGLPVDEQQKYHPIYDDLYHQLVRVGMQQKTALVNKMLEAEGNKWLRYKWLLEKKFPEFNQGCIMEKFRRENSYLDEDYPMYHAKKNKPQSTVVATAPAPPPAPVEKQATVAIEKNEATTIVSDNDNKVLPPVSLPIPSPVPAPEAKVSKPTPPHMPLPHGHKKAKHKKGLKLMRMA